MDINAEIQKLVEEMREVGRRPAPIRGGNYNDMLRYDELRREILERFLDAWDDGYRLGK